MNHQAPPSLEEMILNAGNSIEVDSHRRPSVMEYTHAALVCRKAWQIGAVMMTVFLCALIPIGSYLSSVRSKTEANNQELQQFVENQLSTSDWSWNLAGWYQERKDNQARQFRGASRDKN